MTAWLCAFITIPFQNPTKMTVKENIKPINPKRMEEEKCQSTFEADGGAGMITDLHRAEQVETKSL